MFKKKKDALKILLLIIWYLYVHEFKVKVYSVPFSCVTMF